MAGKSDTFEFHLLRFIYNAVAISSLASTAGTTTLWLGAHTADPTDACSTAAEGGYAAYTRIATERSTAANGWTVTSGTSAALATASPVGAISFPQNTATSTGTFSYGSIWMSSNGGSSACLYYGPISPTIPWQQNTTPQLTTGSSITEE